MIKTTRTTSRALLAVAISASALLAACGGGGTSGSSSTSTGTSSNTISVSQLAVTAGQTLPVAAKATFRAATPSAMSWAISYNGIAAGTGGTGIPSFADATCVGSSLQAPAFTNSLGVGSCTTVLTIPANTPTGVWRITNTATSTEGTVTDAVDITVTPQPSGFAMVSSSTPIAATAGQTVTLSLPYTATTGAVVSNVQYSWTEAAGNPAKSTIVGAGNPVASVIVPTTIGAYIYNVTSTAMVNGVPASGNGMVVVNVAASTSTAETVSAGDVQVFTTADSAAVVKLTGTILKLDTAANYTYQWTQINPTGSLPALALANANSSTASLSVPTVPGTYAFRLTVTKTVNGTAIASFSADTSVVVQATQTPVFTLSAGNAQTVTVGTVATLTGTATPQTVSTSNPITYSYQWTQTGATPATVALSNANTRTASFVPSVPGTYQFTLAVTAMNGISSSTVYANTQVIVVGAAAKGFTVTAGNAQTIKVSTAAAMVGAVTTQGDYTGAVFTYAWTQVAGPVVTVANATAATASVVPTAIGTYTFQLDVTCVQNGVTTTGTAQTQVLVTP